MVTDSAEKTWSPRAAGPTLRQLWQVPVFFLGLAVLVAACLSSPPWKSKETERVERELAAARRLLDQPDARREQFTALAERLQDRLPQLGGRAGEVHFLLGSIHLRLAAAHAGTDAGDHDLLARRHFEEADRAGVPQADRARLTFRLGKAWFRTEADPQAVVDALSRSVAEAASGPAEAFEGYGLLAQAYLRLPTPDLAGALRASEKQLELPEVDDEVLAPARLLRGELLLRLKRAEDARRVLGNIGAHSPPAVRARAHFLSARSLQDEGRWQEAAALWKEMLADPQLTPREPGWALYYLGVCYRHLDILEEAVRAWTTCAGRADGGDEAVAAALGLAELHLADHAAAALEAFERAVRDIHTSADWQNTLLDLTQARAFFERGCEIYREAGDFERAIRLARLYERLAPSGEASYLRGRAAEAWARARQEAVTSAGAAEREREEAHVQFRKAGEAYEQAAAQTPDAVARRERLWLSAVCYRQGQDRLRTVAMFGQFLKQEQDLSPEKQDPQRLGEGWFWLGEAHRQLKSEANARMAYRQSIIYRTPHAYRARHQLALAEIASADIDEAVSTLDLNLRLLSQDVGRVDDRSPASAIKREAEEKSLYLLAQLLFQKGRDYLAAVTRLEQALRLYGDSPESLRARFQLAECHRHLAAQQSENFRLAARSSKPEAQAHYQKEYHRRLELSVRTYLEVVDILSKRPAESLTAEERTYLRRSGFAAAEAQLTGLGQYDGALLLYDRLAGQYTGRIEELYARAGIAQCYWIMGGSGDPRARRAVEQIRAVLKALDDKAFETETRKRAYWEDWLAKVSKQ